MKQIGKQTRHTNKQTHKQTDTQTNRHTNKPTHKQTNKQTHKQTDKQKHATVHAYSQAQTWKLLEKTWIEPASVQSATNLPSGDTAIALKCASCDCASACVRMCMSAHIQDTCSQHTCTNKKLNMATRMRVEARVFENAHTYVHTGAKAHSHEHTHTHTYT